ncbi:MAG: hypothetical protein D6808_03945, partial [Candidatus Dadabacteria bacterium]
MRRFFKVISCILVICTPTASFAGSGSGNEISTYYQDIVDAEFNNSLMDPQRDFSGFTLINKVRGNIAAIHLNDGNPCTGSTCYGPSEGIINPGSVKVPMRAMIPGVYNTQANLLNSDDFVNLSENNLTSPAVVRAVTLYLTESAVAAGETNAHKQAAAVQSNLMLENMQAMMLAERFNGAREIMEAYFHCIQNRLEEGKGYAKAHYECSKDSPSMSSGAAGAVGSASGFSFQDHPSYSYATGSGSTTLADPTTIRLTDIFFNEESTSAVGGEQLVRVRDSFRELYGDIEFELNHNGKDMYQRIRIIPALMTPAEYYGSAVVDKFNTFRQILHEACTKYNQILDNATQVDASQYQVIQDVSAALTGVVGGSNLLKKVSVPGFSVTA